MDTARIMELVIVILLAPAFLGILSWGAVRIVAIQNDFTKFKSETDIRITNICKTCDEQHNWLLKMQAVMNRTERNIVALCQKSGVEYEKLGGS